ncbi:hypothetical protein PoB_005366400 [Plakobranchus ocellatus]|uniref:Uncharacterized protein n=1 Tax=Plakobranchus ocellatus TaxID=259542 RepID=A0AAV4C7V9_9GAST|nr:hypothetical protein PoB_005366400 [Plakobranchus ocellatus]
MAQESCLDRIATAPKFGRMAQDQNGLLHKGLKRLSYPFSAEWTQRSNEKLTWPGLGFEPRTSDLVANYPTR